MCERLRWLMRWWDDEMCVECCVCVLMWWWWFVWVGCDVVLCGFEGFCYFYV